jgi:AraC-like DNA-binding protein
MPLYIDIQEFNAEISIDDVKKVHNADKEVQDRYGVTYHQFWVNKESGMVFCLAEGPDKETLEKVHQTAHGNIACTIVEVEPGFFKLFMGDGQPIDHGLVLNGRKTTDSAYRHFMVADIRTIGAVLASEDQVQSLMLIEQKNLVLERIVRFKGRVVERLADELLVGVFDTAVNAVRCAKVIQHDLKELSEKTWAPFNFRMGLCSRFPLTPSEEFFNDALQLARKLCLSAPDKEVLVSSLTSQICKLEELAPLRPLGPAEENFLMKLFEQVENNLSNEDLNVDHLSRTLGISRPQLYRKVISLTGRSCNHFISSIRMERALVLIKNKFGNISEIALEVGYCNPSYFSRCFQKNFGCTPSDLIKMKPVPHL